MDRQLSHVETGLIVDLERLRHLRYYRYLRNDWRKIAHLGYVYDPAPVQIKVDTAQETEEVLKTLAVNDDDEKELLRLAQAEVAEVTVCSAFPPERYIWRFITQIFAKRMQDDSKSLRTEFLFLKEMKSLDWFQFANIHNGGQFFGDLELVDDEIKLGTLVDKYIEKKDFQFLRQPEKRCLSAA